MAKVKLENTSDGAIYLAIPGSKEKPSTGDFVNVPRCVKTESVDEKTNEKRTKTVVGTAEVDSEVWDQLKKNPVVTAYLSSGRLRVAGSAGPPPAPADAEKGKGKG